MFLKINPNPVQPLLQIAKYLSERGFTVLRYVKRGIGGNFTILDKNLWRNMTFNDLKQDAEKALNVLMAQPEVNDTKKNNDDWAVKEQSLLQELQSTIQQRSVI
ncbi:MAG: hypothetical protein WCF23_07730 [Candidatus Nitrosopolaris sp.]